MHLKLLYCLFVTFLVKVQCFPSDEECLKAEDFTTVDDLSEVIGEWHYQTHPPNCTLPSQYIRVVTPEDEAKVKGKCGEKYHEFDLKLVLAFTSTVKDAEEFVTGYIATRENKTYFTPNCNYIMIMGFRKMGDYVVMLRASSGALVPFSMKMPGGKKQQCVMTKEGRVDFCDVRV